MCDGLMLIAIVGHRATGKDTAAAILEDLGFEHVSFSATIAEIAVERGWLDPDLRTNKSALADAAARVRDELGEEAYVSRMLRDGVVLSGMRHPKELELLRASDLDVLVIALSAPDDMRAERAISLGIVDSIEQLRELEKHRSDTSIDVLIEEADVIVSNDASVEDLQVAIENVIEHRERLSADR